jgi:two-component system cell cycle sensor histidine kinase/response regulator CckA
MAQDHDCADGHSGATILVVEDSEAIRRVVCAMLSQHGYRCLEAANGAEALDTLRAGQEIQLILTDIVMPEMGGAELAVHLDRDYPSIPILFMSGYSENPLVRAIERTAIFLPKPFTATALTTSVRRALDEPWPGLTAWYLGLSPR